jgi:hypothetical protein
MPHAGADEDDVGPLTAAPEIPAQGKEISMALVQDINLRGRLRLTVVAIVLTTLATAMAGASAAGSSPSSPFPGFLLDRGRYTTFDAPEAVFATLPYGINDRGQIVGRYDDASSEQPFLRDKAAGSPTSRSEAPGQPGPSTSTTMATSWASTVRTPRS